ncbi:DUF2961 domain-containing protein [Parashewanella spongiae]|nr:glycoside hydrolase family 172 protein [Parashewanella spongiae]MCL1077934.1 DUF2961 domain-containing protein [Parashewanella spongiae]
MFNGLGSLSHLSNARSRSITPENFSGEAGKGGMATTGTGAIPSRELGVGWKVSPSIDLKAGETFTLADINKQGMIQHIWLTKLADVKGRDLILRMYWDDQVHPSVEVPLGDFFCNGWEHYAEVNSMPVAVLPGKSYNCFWEMPFRSRAKITLENRSTCDTQIYYQVDYSETEIDKHCAYFHASFQRQNPTEPKTDFTIVDNIEGQGHYIGTYMAWGVNSPGWWGEGEVKFYIDDDKTYPTICGTGTEDYFLGSHNYDIGVAEPGKESAYSRYNSLFAGVPQVIRPDGVYQSQTRFGMYRWHIPDPIRFKHHLKVTCQVLGWFDFANWDGDIKNRKYRPRQDDVSAVAFWYQTLPSVPFKLLQTRDELSTN